MSQSQTWLKVRESDELLLRKQFESKPNHSITLIQPIVSVTKHVFPESVV